MPCQSLAGPMSGRSRWFRPRNAARLDCIYHHVQLVRTCSRDAGLPRLVAILKYSTLLQANAFHHRASALPGPGARGSIRTGSDSCPKSLVQPGLPSARDDLEGVEVIGRGQAASILGKFQHEQTSAPRHEARAAFQPGPTSLWVMLRRPKATVTQSNQSSGNGSFSASHWATGNI